MFRKRLIATAAAAPLLVFAGGALAETTITDTRTTGVATATINSGAPDDIKITSTGKIRPAAAGVAVTVNSNNDVTNQGEIRFEDLSDSTGIQVNAGVTSDVTNTGQITLVDTTEQKDDDKDGDLDGAFAVGGNRYGVNVLGALTGNVVNDTGGTITIEGNDSYGIRLQGPLTGNLTNNGSINVTGDNAYGVRVGGPVTGNVTIKGAVTALGQNAVGVAIDDDVTGKLTIQGAIGSRGYRYTARPTLAADRAKLDADDLLQGGPGLRVAGNVTGGILLDAAPNAGFDYDGDGIANADDTDDDNDGVLDTTDTDLDNDGIADSTEGTAGVTVFGGQPALLIGSTTEAITIGAVGPGADNRGLVVRGTISANGLYDDVEATAIELGTAAGHVTTLTGGMRLQGSTTVVAYDADAQAIRLRNGAVADTLDLEGVVFAATTAASAPFTAVAPAVAEEANTAYGVRIDAGATVNTIRNSGTLTVVANGEKSDAVAVRDSGGHLTYLENTGTIVTVVSPTDDAADTDDANNLPGDETVTGRAIAIDVSAALAGVTVRQFGVVDGDDDLDPDTTDLDEDGDGVDDADEPAMVGEIRFGAFADTFNLQNGTYDGDITFGAGADVYTITGGAEATGAIRDDAAGQLTVNLTAGTLTVTNTETIDATALNIGATSALIFTADPTAGTNTRFDVATANIASGAKLGLTLTDLIDGPERYTVISTGAGGLTVGTLDQSLLGNSPFLFVTEASADTTLGEVYIDVRRRTAAEMTLNQSQGLALDAVYDALVEDDDIRDAFLSAQTRNDFLDLYDQMLPDQGEGLFSSLDVLTRTISRLTATRPDLRQRYGPDSFWIQEINVQVMRDAGVTAGSETKAFGFAGGYESMGADGGALGATLAFVSAEERDDVAKVGEETSVALLEAGIYWRRSVGNFSFSARGAAGYGWFTGDRRFVDPVTGTDITASADWNAFTGVLSASAAYEATVGRFYARPSIAVDYLYVAEGSRTEEGKSAGFNQEVDDRTSDRLAAVAELAIGATFGRDLWWRPELRVGYRQHLAGEMGDTVFRFENGTWVALPASEPGDGTVLVGLSLKAGTAMSYVAVEGEYEVADGEDRYNLNLSGRVMF